MRFSIARWSTHRWILAAAFALTALVYWPGLYGGFIFDDYPNIVDNHGVQPPDASLSSLVGAALSSPASDFKRPLAALSFALNYLVSGIDPFWMKLTNLIIHLLNGWLVWLLSKALLEFAWLHRKGTFEAVNVKDTTALVAALVAAGWMLLPINLTAVLYVVQRMESIANLFVMLGLLGYVQGRRRMLADNLVAMTGERSRQHVASGSGAFILCCLSIIVCAALGLLAKETAVLLPLYALIIEWALFRFGKPFGHEASHPVATGKSGLDIRVIALFVIVLAIPMAAGLTWLIPGLLKPEAWAARDFTLVTRLLSELRIAADYIVWTLLPTPDALSFYHDDFRVSTSFLAPWTTLVSLFVLLALLGLMFRLRARYPVASLGIALFFGCQVLTATVLPLELIYEHRNYFASFGLLLTIVPLLAVPRGKLLALPRQVFLGGLLIIWTGLTALTSYAWGNPLRLSQDLASRAPKSPRAQYELGRTFIIYSQYDPASPFTKLAYAPLERSAQLPDSSILPEQALLFMNARMHLPLKNEWWNSLISKLETRKPGVQDESSLAALTQCAKDHICDLPKDRMIHAFWAAMSHPAPSSRLLATYGDYAWNIVGDHDAGERATEQAVSSSPNEPAYQITLIRMLTAQGRLDDAQRILAHLKTLDTGGRLKGDLAEFRALSEKPADIKPNEHR